MGFLDNIAEFASSPEGRGFAGGLLSGGFGAGAIGMNNARAREQEFALRKQMHDAQMQEIQAQAMHRKAQADQLMQERARQEGIQNGLSSLFGGGVNPGSIGFPDAGGVPMTSQAQVQTPSTAGPVRFDAIRAATQFRMRPEEIEKYAKLADLGRAEVARTVEGKDAQGRPVTLQYDKYGNQVGQGVEQWKAPIQIGTGDKQNLVDPVNNQIRASFAMGQSPDSAAASALGWANYNTSRQRLAMDQAQTGKPQFHDGQWVLPPSQQNPQGVSIPVPGFNKPMGEGQKKQVTGIDALSSAIDEYKKELGDFKGAALISPDKRAAMGTKYNNMMLQAKEAYNLGVLNGPDLGILQSVVADPSSMKGAFISNDALKKQASELDRIMQGTRAAVVNGGRTSPKTEAPSLESLLQKYAK